MQDEVEWLESCILSVVVWERRCAVVSLPINERWHTREV